MKTLTILLTLCLSLAFRVRADTAIEVGTVEVPVRVRFLNASDGGLSAALEFRNAQLEFVSPIFFGPQARVDSVGLAGPAFEIIATLPATDVAMSYDTYLMTVLAGGGTYRFRRTNSVTVSTSESPSPLVIEEAAGGIDVQFVSATTGAAVSVRDIRVESFLTATPGGESGVVASGRNGEGQAEMAVSGPTTAFRLIARGGATQRVEVFWNVGTVDAPAVQRHEAIVVVPANGVVTLTCPVTLPSSLGALSGGLDVLGETERAPSVVSVQVRQLRGGSIPVRSVQLIGAPATGPFLLPNLVAGSYQLNASVELGEGTRRELFTFPNQRPLISVNPGPATTAAGGLLVVQPGYVRGRVRLEGPVDTTVAPSPLRFLKQRSAAGSEYSVAVGTGLDLSPGTFPASNGGQAQVNLEGALSADANSWDGQYRLALADRGNAPSLWSTHLSLVFQNPDRTRADLYLNERVDITDNVRGLRDTAWRVTSGSDQVGDFQMGFGEVCVVVTAARGEVWAPSLRASGTAAGPNYSIDLTMATGLPTERGSGRPAIVHAALPVGVYPHVAVAAMIDSGGGPATVTLPNLRTPLRVASGERQCLVNCLRAELDVADCLRPGGTNRAVARASNCDGRVITRLSWQLDDEAPHSICTNCGDHAESPFSFIAPADGRPHRLRVLAEDAAGMPASDDRELAIDTLPPVVVCPADIVVDCASSDGAVVDFVATATDVCSDASLVCTPPSGSRFPLGTTTVVCTATDAAGNQTNCSFSVRVNGGGTPPIRSTFYSGTATSGVRFEHQNAFEPAGLPLTLEAWVYRETNGDDIQTIVSRSYRRGYWFGFAGAKLRFYRRGIFAGNFFADARDAVPTEQWTHVAVTYDGAMTRFFIDGRPASEAVPLGPVVGLPFAESLYVGQDPEGFRLKGYLDELRIWGVARTEAELSAGLFTEIRDAAGLQAVFPQGGAFESRSGAVGTRSPGATEAIWGILPRDLVVPQAATAVTLDGQLNLATEYAGAEEMVIRYRDGANGIRDGHAYLVHRQVAGDTNLYVGVQRLRFPRLLQPIASSQVALFVDSNLSGGATPQFGDLQLLSPLDGGVPSSRLGTGSTWGRLGAPGRGVAWDVKTAFCDGDVHPRCHEFRLSAPYLNGFQSCVGFALGQLDTDIAGGDDLVPGSLPDQPSTWARLRFGGPVAALPTGTFSGRVLDGEFPTGRGVSGLQVRVLNTGNGENIGSPLTTDGNGDFAFTGAVPSGVLLALQLDVPAGWRGRSVHVLPGSGTGPSFESASHLYLRFPPCDGAGSCAYRPIQFIVQRPAGPIRTTGFTPATGISKVKLRTAPERFSPATRVIIQGENLHPDIRVWLYDCPTFGLPPETVPDLGAYLAGQPACREGNEYRELTVVSVASDGRSAELEMPELPVTNLGRDLFFLEKLWRLFLHDGWERPGYRAWQELPGRLVELPPPFPWVHGFSFMNEGDVPAREAAGTVGLPGYDNLEFEALFGKELHWGCACDVPDPLYALVYEPIYNGVMDVAAGIGACSGFNATAQALALGRLDPLRYEPGVRFGAGFGGLGSLADGLLHPPKPARYSSRSVIACEVFGFDVGSCDGIGPGNLWSQIRVNHGVILSWEFISALIDGTDTTFLSSLGTGSIRGGQPRSIGRYLRERRNDPQGLLGSVVVIAKDFSSAHSLTPYAIKTEADPNLVRVLVYDSNNPGNAERQLDIDLAANSYRYEFAPGDVWSGTGIWRFPLSIWLSQHSFTSPLDVLGGAARFLLSGLGAADIRISSSEGEWGWRNGERVDTLPGALAVPVPAMPVYGRFTPPLLLPSRRPDLTVSFDVLGTNYGLVLTGGGVALNLQMLRTTPGSVDVVELHSGAEMGEASFFGTWENSGYSRFTLRSQKGVGEVRPQVVFTSATGEQLIYQFSGLSMPTGQVVALRVDRVGRRIALKNETGVIQTPLLKWTLAGATPGTNQTVTTGDVPFPPLPLGATAVLEIQGDELIVRTDLQSDGTFDSESKFAVRTQPSPPALQIQHDGEEVVLQWPVTDPPWFLSTANSLTGPWSTVMAERTANGLGYRWRTSLSEAALFGRLVPPTADCFALVGLPLGRVENPWEPAGTDLRFESFDLAERPLLNQEIARDGELSGLRILGRLEVDLLVPCGEVTLEVWRSEALSFEVFEIPDAAPRVINLPAPSIAGITNMVFRGIGRPLTRVRVRSSLKPALLLRVCCPRAPRSTPAPAGAGVCLRMSELPPGSQPNPTTLEGITFTASDAEGRPLGDTRIGTELSFSAYVGYHVQHTVELVPERPCSRMTISLFEQSGLVDCIAYNAARRELSRSRVSGIPTTPQTVTLDGAGFAISYVRIVSPNDRTVLLEVCCEPWVRLAHCREVLELAPSPITNPIELSDLTLTFRNGAPLRPPPLRLVAGETGIELAREQEFIFHAGQSAVQLRLVAETDGATVSVETFQADGRLVSRLEPVSLGAGPQVLSLSGPEVRQVILKLALGKAILTDVCTPRGP